MKKSTMKNTTMKNTTMKKKTTNTHLILLISGIILAVLGYFFMLLGQDQASHDTVAATATVKEYVEDTAMEGRLMVTVYYPVLTYDVDGTTVTSQYSEYFDDQIYPVGDSIDIKYNPDNPEEYILVGDDVDNGTKGLFAVALGIALAIIGLGWMIVEKVQKVKAGKKD